MVYITGDMHGDPRNLIRFSKAHSLTSEDTIIILGDAGFNFYLHGRDRKAKKPASYIPANLLCIHGNHEARLQSLPELYHGEERFGASAMVEDAFPNIRLAVDGEVYDVEGFSAIAIGGAYSIDKLWRCENGLPWFADEQPSEQSKQRVEQVLTACD